MDGAGGAADQGLLAVDGIPLLGGFAMGIAIHRIPYWTERGFDAQTVSLAFSADASGAAFMIMASGFVLDRVPSRFTAASAFAGFAGAVTIMRVATNVLHMFPSTVLFGFSAGTNQVSQTFCGRDTTKELP